MDHVLTWAGVALVSVCVAADQRAGTERGGADPSAPAQGAAAAVEAPCPVTEAPVDRFVHAPGTQVSAAGGIGRVEASGRGPTPMILIPGAPFDGSVWSGFMARNADRYRMYALTPAGYGGTRPPPMPEDPQSWAGLEWTRALTGAIAALIEREGLDRPVLVGHHYMSDTYALRVAIDHPELVRGVVIVAGRGSAQYPSMSRKKGDPPGAASAAERERVVSTFVSGMYRRVNDRTWRMGSLSADLFCRDGARARALFEEQVSVPVPTQVRYMLEYQVTDVNADLGRLACPVLVVQPGAPAVTLASVLERYGELYAESYGTIEKAREVWEQQLTRMWGGVELGVAKMFDPVAQWREIASAHPERIRLETVEDTGAFIMEDQPARLDELVAGFVSGLGK